MKTINLSKYAPAITMKNVGIVNQDIREGLQSNQPFVIDFKGIEGIEMAAASELLNPLRSKYGTRYRQEVQFQNVNPLVGNAFVFSGRTDSTVVSSPRRKSFISRMFFTLLLLLTLGVGQMWANGGIGYKGVKFNKNGSTTGWYNIHDVDWDYTYGPKSGETGVTAFNNADLGTVTTLKLEAFVVIGWTDNSDYVAGQLKHRLYLQSASAGSYNTYDVGNYSNPSWGSTDVLVSSSNNRVVGKSSSMNVDIVTSSTPAGNYYLQLQGLGRMQYTGGGGGSFNENNGSEVKATLVVPGFTTTSTSNNFGSVTVDNSSSTTISFTQHYGTTLTTSNCAITGTNASDFSVTSISETGVTVSFTPAASGSRSATLTITDADDKTCTITLSGTGTAETTHSVTVTYVCPSTSATVSSSTSPNIGEITYSEQTAPTVAGYTFSSWSYGNGISVKAGDNTSSNPIHVKTLSSGTYTLTANYTEDLSSPYIVTGGNKIVTSGTTWRTTADANNKMNKKTGYSTSSDAYFTVNVTAVNQGDANSNYQFKIYNTSTSTYYGLTAEGQYYYGRDKSGSAKDLSSSGANIELRADALGEYEIKVNYSSDPTVTITYPTVYTVTFGSDGNGTVSASYSSTSFDSGTKVQSGKTVRFTQSPAAGYQFKEWNTQSDGNGTQLSTNSSYYDRTVASTNNVYAIYTPITYTNVKLDKTTGSTDGEYSVTYKGTSLTVTTTPAKTGYEPEGYYKDYNSGTSTWSNKVATPEGTLQANMTYTNSDGQWVATTSPTLYTKWQAKTYTGDNNLDKNGGDSHGKYTATYNATTIAINTTPLKSGYHVDGYYKEAGLTNLIATSAGALQSGTAYTDASSHWTNDGNVTLHTKWAPNNYTITFNGNKGSRPGTPSNIQATVTVTYDDDNFNVSSTPVSTVAIPVLAGYTFGGYYTAVDGGGTQIVAANGAWIVPGSGKGNAFLDDAGNWVKAANTTVYAKWTENNYTVTVAAGAGGSVASTSVTGHISTLADLPTATPSNGYYFVNWTTTAGTLTNSTSASTGQINGLTSDATVTANFAKIYYLQGSKTEMGSWETENDMSYASANTYSVTLTLAAKTEYEFKIFNRQTSVFYGASSTSLTRASSSKTGLTTTDGATYNIHITTDAAGDYTFTYVYNASVESMQVSVTYQTAYTVTFGSDGHGTVTASATSAGGSMTSGDYVASGDDITFTQSPATGYTFKGWYNAASAGTAISSMASDNVYDDIAANATVYAQYNAKTYTITLNQQTDTAGYRTSGSTSLTATFDAAFPSETMPTAIDGWAFVGYWSEARGKGTQFTDKDGALLANIDGYSDESGHWTYDGTKTLYAYYKKAEISLALDKTTAAPSSAGHPDSITVTPTISPTPEGEPRICWTILQNNNNPVAEQPTIRHLSGNSIRFATMEVSGNYKVAAVLRIGGSNCEDGTVLDADTVNFIIAGNHTVTIQYKYGTNVIRAASSETVGALDSVAITAPEITGYTFSYWTFGEGVFSNKIPEGKDTVQNVNPIKVVATYDATLTANYTKKNMIYFNNTLGWSDVYVYFYSSDKYWANDFIEGQGCGTGSDKDYVLGGSAAYYRGYHGHMTNIEGTNIWYYDYEAEWGDKDEGEIKGYEDVVFVETEQNDYQFFYQNKACRRGDFKHSIPMFVPLTTPTNTKNETEYYSNGYWMNYPESTGYTLKIYSGTDKSKSDEIHSIPFEFTEDMTMPMELTVELNAATTYGFEIYRNDGNYYGNNATMQSGNSGDDGQTIWQFETSRSQRAGLLTSAAGDYTFKLSYGLDQQVTPAYNYLVGVHYPAGLNDYRIVYNDRVAWSQSTSHDASWYHPSRTIHKEDGATDIVSFYVSKAEGANASMKFQYVSAINAGTGAVTWTDVTGGAISAVDTISKSGVYNFHLSQANETITVSKVEPYNGNYYIRTDYAGTTGWDFYRASDHKMTYTEFSKNRSTNTFGDLFSHYYAHWCERSHNIKFTVANDYSSCISDTLENDLTNFNNMTSGAWLKTDGSVEAYQDIYSANIRFMYNESTNKISRAYVSSSTHVTRRFLVLAGTAGLKDANGNDIPATANLEANAVLFNDDQNFMYEVTVKAIPGARVKLYAKYNDIDQYFRGVTGEFTDANTIELLGGGGETPQKVKVVYDFKTNRLVTAWEPDGAAISDTIAINADVMINRDHQGSGEAITFGNNSGKLDKVKTVYGTMTFNRWILNNRAGEDDMVPEHCADAAAITEYHPVLPVADQKSIYERSLYFLSFPFDVKLSEVFGFGHYWDEWYIEYYDGLTRARNGFWADSDPNWKYVLPEDANDFVLRANEGYILGLDLDYMRADNFNFWTNKSSQVVLYFPSTTNIDSITSTEAVIPALGEEYKCTINRGTTEGDRRVKDSYWRCIGVPGYSSYNQTLTTDGGGTITWQTSTEWHADLEDYPFLYEWNSTDNTLTPQATSNYTFKSMHAYLVQNQRAIHWSAISATPVSPIVARQNTGTVINYNWCLTLERNGVLEDKTHIRMTNSETVTDGFDFGPDMSKEFNAKRSDIYTLIGYERAAANSMPIHENQTTIIPVGVSIETTGEYTFAMPEGTHGVGVKLNDTETGTQTNLSAGLSYTLTLNKGDYTNRFFIEISPVQGATTDVEKISDEGLEMRGARKVIIDQKLFIIKGDKMYDARGAMVK